MKHTRPTNHGQRTTANEPRPADRGTGLTFQKVRTANHGQHNANHGTFGRDRARRIAAAFTVFYSGEKKAGIAGLD